MKKLICIEGPTAVGKTAYAIELAQKLSTEIISADSRQFYKELNIGVARPSVEELSSVQHHFIAFKSIDEYYSVSSYEKDALALLDKLFAKHDTVVLCGGSGLYVNVVCNGMDALPDVDAQLRQSLIEKYNNEGIESLRQELKMLDPKAYQSIDIKNHTRIRRALEVCIQTAKPYSEQIGKDKQKRSFEIERYALNMDREKLYRRIEARVDVMLSEGLVEEARSLYEKRHLTALQTVGYRELFEHFDGNLSLEEAVEKIKMNTRRYAKRQLTWLRHQTNCKFIDL